MKKLYIVSIGPGDPELLTVKAARLIARADQIAVVASRVMGAAVAGVSLLVAALGVARWTSPAFEAWTEGRELAFGATVLAVIALGYGLALWLARRQAAPA